jgi:hypothetical protein
MRGKARVPRRLREHVARESGYRCGYCRTPQSIAGFRLTVEWDRSRIRQQSRSDELQRAVVWFEGHI